MDEISVALTLLTIGLNFIIEWRMPLLVAAGTAFTSLCIFDFISAAISGPYR